MKKELFPKINDNMNRYSVFVMQAKPEDLIKFVENELKICQTLANTPEVSYENY